MSGLCFSIESFPFFYFSLLEVDIDGLGCLECVLVLRGV